MAVRIRLTTVILRADGYVSETNVLGILIEKPETYFDRTRKPVITDEAVIRQNV